MPIAPILETERLILRPPETRDAFAIHQHMNDWEIVKFFPRKFPVPYPLEKAYEFVAMAHDPAREQIFWAITLRATNEFIGIVDIRPHVTNDGQRGFWIARAYQNKGYMSEALQVVNDYWFDVLGKTSLLMRNAESNYASNRLKEKTGARLVKTIPSDYLDTSCTHSQLWEMTKEEWQAYKMAPKTLCNIR